VVKNYDEFVAHIKLKGLGAYEVISLDHDLGEGALIEYYTHTKQNYELDYNRITEKTGMDCARFLVAESMNTKIPLPTIYVHSANPIGAANIIGYINNYFRNCKLPEVCMKVNIEHTFTNTRDMANAYTYMRIDKLEAMVTGKSEVQMQLNNKSKSINTLTNMDCG
jgi:uncharacterized alpha/beta hydrolase family protein